MGRIKTQLVKRVGFDLVDKHKKELTNDFNKNKEVIAKHAEIRSKKIRNVITGYVTRLIKEKKEI